MTGSVKYILQLLLVIVLTTVQLTAQKDAPVLQQRASLDVENVTIDQLLDEIKSQTDLRFFYKSEAHREQTFTIKANNETLTSILDQALAPVNYSYVVYKESDVVLVPIYLATNEFSASYPTSNYWRIIKKKCKKGNAKKETL